MTNSTPNIPILDDDAVAEIEARANAAAEGPWRWRRDYEMPDGDKHWELSNPEGDRKGKTIDASLVLLLDRDEWLHRPAQTQPNWEFIAHAREDIPALCATVRALRADVLTMQAAYDKATSELKTENTALREQVAKMREALGVSSTDRERDLESQLEQVTKELNEEKRLRAELKQIANAGFDDISSFGTTLKENAVIDFRSRAIALCRDKAVEYRKELEHYERGEEEFAQLNSYAAAADVLARELEQLK